MTSPILKKRKNTFSKYRDSTLKTSVFNNNNKESTFQEPPNKLSTSFMRREMLPAALHGVTVGLESLLMGNAYHIQTGKDGDKKPPFFNSSPLLWNPEKVHTTLPPPPPR